MLAPADGKETYSSSATVNTIKLQQHLPVARV